MTEPAWSRPQRLRTRRPPPFPRRSSSAPTASPGAARHQFPWSPAGTATPAGPPGRTPRTAGAAARRSRRSPATHSRQPRGGSKPPSNAPRAGRAAPAPSRFPGIAGAVLRGQRQQRRSGSSHADAIRKRSTTICSGVRPRCPAAKSPKHTRATRTTTRRPNRSLSDPAPSPPGTCRRCSP